MKIALLGYGKMGKVIERIAQERGHEIVLRKTSDNSFAGLEKADVAIDFSIPKAAVNNITTCFEYQVPVISGTTGWIEELSEVESVCHRSGGAMIWSSNFSLGVNLFFELNRYLSQLMAGFDIYKVGMQEIHHTQKLDAPSGTAISLAQDIIANTNYENWTLENPDEKQIKIDAVREGEVPGTHSITYQSEIDSIEITHKAFNREGFALGSVIAAEWILGKKGVFSMKDVLNLNQ